MSRFQLARRHLLKGLPTAALLLGLSACGSLSPTRLWRGGYELNPTPLLPGSVAPVGWNLLIAAPEAGPPQDGLPILSAADSLPPAPLPDGAWQRPPAQMLQDALLDAFHRSGAVERVGLEGDGTPASLMLKAKIEAFQVEEPSGEPARVRVALNLNLIRASDGQKLGFSSVAGQAAPTSMRPAAIVDAFNEAAGNAIREAVNWTLRTGERAPLD